MDRNRFDELAMWLAGGQGRRATRRGLSTAVLTATLAGAGIAAAAPAAAARRCFIEGRRCERDGQCCSGRCARGDCAGCPKGRRACGHACVRAASNPKHCGGCNRRCGAGQLCLGGDCACADGGTPVAGPDPSCWLAWGGEGSGDGQFRFPRGVAVGGNGHVYVADTDNDRIQEFDATGGFVRTWGSTGGGDGQFRFPQGVAVDLAGHLFVADANNHRIQGFDATKPVGAPGFFVRAWGGIGGGEGQFIFPFGVAVGGGQVYVADAPTHRIQAFTATGGFVRQWGSEGGGEGQFRSPRGVAAGGAGQVYVADLGNDRVQVFDATKAVGDPRVFVRAWGSNGSGDGQFVGPGGVAVGANGRTYVADSYNGRIEEFDATGGFLRTWGSRGAGIGRFNFPIGVAAGGGHGYVADTNNHRIVRVTPV